MVSRGGGVVTLYSRDIFLVQMTLCHRLFLKEISVRINRAIAVAEESIVIVECRLVHRREVVHPTAHER